MKPIFWHGGICGLCFEMTLEEAEYASHPGPCDDDVLALSKVPHIAEQLDRLDTEDIRRYLWEFGAWDDEELADDAENRLRFLWSVACEIQEEAAS